MIDAETLKVAKILQAQVKLIEHNQVTHFLISPPNTRTQTNMLFSSLGEHCVL